MGFLDNLNIKAKLALLLVLPILGFIIFSIIEVTSSYKRLDSMDKIERVVILATKISALVHETQKERGMTAGYLGSKGKKFKDKLPSQRELSNKQFKNLTIYMSTIDFSDYPSSFKKKMDEAVNDFKGLSNIRPKVDSFQIQAGKAIGYYTTMNSHLLDKVVLIAKMSDNAKMTQELTSYSSFLLSKERAGIERAVGSNTLSRDNFAPGMREKLNNLISAQDSFMKTFIYYASDDWQNYYKKTVSGKPIDEVNRIRKVMLEATEIGGFNVNAEYWFDTITKKINMLKKVEDFIKQNLYVEDEDVKVTVDISILVSDLLHETQKERGATAGFIGSKGTKFVTKLPNQRKLTDEKLAKLNKYLEDADIDIYVDGFKKNLLDALGKLDKLSSMRTKVSSLSIPAKDAISYYTSINAQLLDSIAAVVKMTTVDRETKDINSFYTFLMSKERAGIERAVLSNSFARNKFLPGMKQKFIVLMTEQYSFLKAFMVTAKPTFVKFYNNTVTGEAVKEVERMRNIALNTTSIGGFGVEATYWFAEITKKINMLKKVDDYLASKLIEDVHEIRESVNNTMILIIVSTVISLLLVLFLSRLITLKIVNALDTFKRGLGYFFEYAVREKDYLKPMEVVGKDEFAQMTADMNEQIRKTEYIIEQDKKVVIEIDDVMAKVKDGFFVFTIKEKGATSEVEALRNNINNMLKETKEKLDIINRILDQFAGGDYILELTEDKKKGMNGDMGSLITSSLLLGTSTSQLMAMISNAGEELNSSTHILTTSSQSLSTSSNAQAASLEETAAAVEQITSNIENNSENVNQMALLADDLNSTAKVGEGLASQTANSMDEINEKVTAINEAITVIDQIAFQTNILSLNAAVEAATAGEAGKGFAVVAQEVRNLAARSAEAAKDIKELVEDATSRSQIGKETSVKMIEGYTSLNEKVIETKGMIDAVSMASKEQHEGMIQINDAINSLDKATQENASTASNIDNLASEVSMLSERLMNITSRAKFDERMRNRVCDVDFVQEISKYKNDHINFKDTNFAKLDSRENWSVTDCKSCNLGKWIIDCELQGRDFVSSPTWSSMKVSHEKIHNQVQDYVTKNASGASKEEITKVSADIESSTYEIFEKLDELLEVHCDSMK